jgi:peptidoglycan/LPS O-acetylase OafA/YrhL
LQYVQLPTHCEGIALGALIAIRVRSGPWEVSKKMLTLGTALLLGGTCVGSFLSTWGTRNQAWGSDWDRLVGYSTSSLGCAGLVLWLVLYRGSKYTRWMCIPPLRYLGKISYGVYMLHPLALYSVIELSKKHLIHFHKDDPRYFLDATAMSILLAAISWHFFEGPLIRIKNQISYGRSKVASAEATA